MKKLAAFIQVLFFLALFSFLVAPTFAAGGFGVGNNLTGFWQKKTTTASVVAITYADEAVDSANASSYNVASVGTGTATSDRISLAGLMCSSGTAGTPRTLSSASINGVSADIIATAVNTGQRESAYIVAAINPTGTTGTISSTWSGQCGRICVISYAMTGKSSTAAFDTAADNNSSASDPSTTIDIPANGSGLAVTIGNAVTTITFSGLTESSDFQAESVNTCGGADDDFASTQTGLTVTANFATNAISSMAVASWGP